MGANINIERKNVNMVKYCMNDLCVYCNDNMCMLDNISINEFGICSEYISVHIPKEEFEKYRQKHLDKLQ